MNAMLRLFYVLETTEVCYCNSKCKLEIRNMTLNSRILFKTSTWKSLLSKGPTIFMPKPWVLCISVLAILVLFKSSGLVEH